MRFVVFCPVGKRTGGPEALHQFVDSLVNQGFEAALCYISPSDGSDSEIREKLQAYANYAGEVLAPSELGDDDHIIWTGPLNTYFNSKLGPIRYRTFAFEMDYHVEDSLGCAVMNYPDQSLDFTRITDHKFFAPHPPTEGTVIYRERSRDAVDGDIRCCPIRLASGEDLLAEYVTHAMQSSGATFAGRLGNYRYLDTGVTIDEALNLGKTLNAAFGAGEDPPVFNASPLG